MFGKDEQDSSGTRDASRMGSEGNRPGVTKRPMMTGSELEEGELYAYRKGKLEKIPRNDEGGMRKVRITEEAFQMALELGNALKEELQGYRPDVALVVSALVVNGSTGKERGKDAVKKYALGMWKTVQ